MRLTAFSAVVAASFGCMANAQTERDLDSHEHGHASLNIAVDNSSLWLELESPWNNLVGFEHAPRTEDQHALVDQVMELLSQPDQLFSITGGNCVVSDTVIESSLESEEAGDSSHAHDDDKDGHEEHAHGEESHEADAHGEKSHDEHAHGEESHDADAHSEKSPKEHAHGEESHEEDAHGEDSHEEDAHGEDSHEEHAHGEESHEEHAHGEEGHEDDHHDGHGDHAGESETHSSMLVSYGFDCSNAAQLASIDVSFLEFWTGFEELDVQLIGPGGQTLIELNQQQRLVDVTQVQ